MLLNEKRSIWKGWWSSQSSNLQNSFSIFFVAGGTQEYHDDFEIWEDSIPDCHEKSDRRQTVLETPLFKSLWTLKATMPKLFWGADH